MDLGITGRTALVFGAGGGLGGAIARTLAREGASVAVADINKDALVTVSGEVGALGVKSISLPWDLADHSVIDENIARIESELGPVDILINNTGGPPPTPVSGQDAAVWEEQFRAMVMSVIAITDRVLPGMRERRWGRVLTSASSGVIAPIPNLGLSNALRSALVGWSKTLAGEVGSYGITSNIIMPGRIATARIQFLDEKKAARDGVPVEQVSAQSSSAIPVGRYGTPQEYADVAAFLTSDLASYVTGSMVRVDGGFIQSV